MTNSPTCNFKHVIKLNICAKYSDCLLCKRKIQTPGLNKKAIYLFNDYAGYKRTCAMCCLYY